MGCSRYRWRRAVAGLVAAASVVIAARRPVRADSSLNAFERSFAFPVSFARGVSGDLVAVPGSPARFTFDRGMVAVGYLPVPRPGRVSRRGRLLGAREFLRPVDAVPRARLLLSGVVDADGNPVNNTGNELVIDAVLSPGSAVSAPPFVIQFDITAGKAFVDAPLPMDGQGAAGTRVQILGAAVVDPEGQPFGMLGFVAAAAPTLLAPGWTPTPAGIPAEGQCFVGPSCSGPSFAAGRERCCHFNSSRSGGPSSPPVSWCPPDQYDPSSGRCTAETCDACILAPTPTPTAGPCGDAVICGGTCSVTCADGTAVAGQCVEGGDRHCACSAVCAAPTPCSVGQCFDTISFQCTGQPCGTGLRCPLPNQFCDVSGRRCPCAPQPPPGGRICCQCTDVTPACFNLSFIDVQPICPPGCKTFAQQECDLRSGNCVAATSCATDQDCDDGNGCTADRCIAGACTHDCVCVGPMGCGPAAAGRH